MLDTIALIKVGPEKTEFRIHKGVLCNASSFFRTALEGGFKETLEQTIEMPEANVDAFKHFQLWLYSRQLSRSGVYSSRREAWNGFVHLYIFAEAYGIPALQNDTIDVLIGLFERGSMIAYSSIQNVYENSPSNSPLRRLIVDTCLYLPLREVGWFQEHLLSGYPKEWLAELILAQDDILSKGPVIAEPRRRNYHVKVESNE